MGRRMEDGHTGDEELSSPLKVSELMAILKNVDPDFLIVIGSDARSLLIVNPRPGLCRPQGLEEDEVSRLTEHDQHFLHRLHIK
jgi:hypothetical protein